MRISRFCWGLELEAAVRGLATYGMVMSVVGVLALAFLVFLPIFLRAYRPEQRSIIEEACMYTGATLLFLVMFGWFVFSHTLYRKNKSEDVAGVKKMIKFGSYIIGFSQVFLLALSIIAGVVFINYGILVVGLPVIIVGGLLLIFPSLLLDGIRRKHAGKVKAWIIFKFVMFGLQLCACFIHNYGLIWINFLQFIGYTIAFMYSSGMVIVHYNILLDDENVLQSASNVFGKGKNNIDNAKKMTEGLEAYVAGTGCIMSKNQPGTTEHGRATAKLYPQLPPPQPQQTPFQCHNLQGYPFYPPPFGMQGYPQPGNPANSFPQYQPPLPTTLPFSATPAVPTDQTSVLAATAQASQQSPDIPVMEVEAGTNQSQPQKVMTDQSEGNE